MKKTTFKRLRQIIKRQTKPYKGFAIKAGLNINNPNKPQANGCSPSSSYDWDMDWYTCFHILKWFRSKQFQQFFKPLGQNVLVCFLFISVILVMMRSSLIENTHKPPKRESITPTQVSNHVIQPLLDVHNITKKFTKKKKDLANYLRETNQFLKGIQDIYNIIQHSKLEEAKQKAEKLNTELGKIQAEELDKKFESFQIESTVQQAKIETQKQIKDFQTRITKLQESTPEILNQIKDYTEQVKSLETGIREIKTLLEQPQPLDTQDIEAWLMKSFASNYHLMVQKNIKIIKENLNYSQLKFDQAYEQAQHQVNRTGNDTTPEPLRELLNPLELQLNRFIKNSKSFFQSSLKNCLTTIELFENVIEIDNLENALKNTSGLDHSGNGENKTNQFRKTLSRLKKRLDQLNLKAGTLHQKLETAQNECHSNSRSLIHQLNQRAEASNTLQNQQQAHIESLNSTFNELVSYLSLHNQCLTSLQTVTTDDLNATRFSNSKLLQALVQSMSEKPFKQIKKSLLKAPPEEPSPLKLTLENGEALLSVPASHVLKFPNPVPRQSSTSNPSLDETSSNLAPKNKSQDFGSDFSNLVEFLSSDAFRGISIKYTTASNFVNDMGNLFMKSFWRHYEKAIIKVKQEQRDNLLKLIKEKQPFNMLQDHSILFQPVPKGKATLKKNNQNIFELMKKAIVSYDLQENAWDLYPSNVNFNMFTAPVVKNLSEPLSSLVSNIHEFTTKQYTIARLYEPRFYQAKSILYQKEHDLMYGSHSSSSQYGQNLEFSLGSRDNSGFSQSINVPPRDLNPFNQLLVKNTCLNQESSNGEPLATPIPCVGFHHSHHSSLVFHHLQTQQNSRGKYQIPLPIVHENQFLRFINQEFTSEWLMHQPFFQNCSQQDHWRWLMKSLNLSLSKNKTNNSELKTFTQDYLKRKPTQPSETRMVNRLTKLELEHPERVKYLDRIKTKICDFGQHYKKVASFPIFKLGPEHSHQATKRGVTQITDSFFQTYIEPFISNQNKQVNVSKMICNKYYQNIKEFQTSQKNPEIILKENSTNKQEFLNVIKKNIIPLWPYAHETSKQEFINLIKKHVMPLWPYAQESESNHSYPFIFHNLETDSYELSKNSRVYQSIKSDLNRLERVLQEDWTNLADKTPSKSYPDLATRPLYHPLLTPYLVDSTLSELIHVLKTHRFPGLPNLTQPFRASCFEFNIHLNECVRYSQHQEFFEELGNLLVQQHKLETPELNVDGIVTLDTPTNSMQKEKYLKNNGFSGFKEYVLPRHLLSVKTVIISHILVALKFGMKFIIAG